MRQFFIHKEFRESSLTVIDMANAICEDYAAQGFDLTLRQLYYQFVARGLIPNKDTEYKRLGSIINDARLAGLLDWDYIVDRTRFLRAVRDYAGPEEALRDAADSYAEDLWADQENRPEVWIEKDALVGVIASVCNKWRVPFFSCRGYVSQSEMYEAGNRFLNDYREQEPVLLHLGDHDPSGVDMSRDIEDRLNIFGAFFTMKRIALNMDQVRALNPPPNPAKITDARASRYIAKYGQQSWELDALDPATLATLIESEIMNIIDIDKFRDALRREEKNRELIRNAVA